jgi:rhodanese-related sulfurtransferase
MSQNEISVNELSALRGVVVVDVREPDEYAGGHVPTAVNIPLGDVRERSPELRGADTVYVICQSGRRSAFACDALESLGITSVNVTGGTSAWIAAGLPVQQ